jgi:hypothetical protein
MGRGALLQHRAQQVAPPDTGPPARRECAEARRPRRHSRGAAGHGFLIVGKLVVAEHPIRLFSIQIGIVNLTLIWQTGQHKQANTQLPTTPFSL